MKEALWSVTEDDIDMNHFGNNDDGRDRERKKMISRKMRSLTQISFKCYVSQCTFIMTMTINAKLHNNTSVIVSE